MSRQVDSQDGSRRGAEHSGGAGAVESAVPRLAILFWCYKDVAFCAERLRLLRAGSPGVQVYVLYSGRPVDSGAFTDALAPYADDFYQSRLGVHPAWRWLNGDLLIADWYKARGRNLNWDTIVVVQWDMLILAHVGEVFRGLVRDQLLVSGTRPVGEVEAWWGWVKRDDAAHRTRYDRFVEHLRATYGLAAAPLCCVFIVACLPRTFLDLYATHVSADWGFLEYRVTMYAQAFGTPIADASRFPVWIKEDPAHRWYHLRASALNGFGHEVPLATILANLLSPGGSRVFHPVRRPLHAGAMRLLTAAGHIGRG